MDAEQFWYRLALASSAISEYLSQLRHLLEPTLIHLTADLDSPPIEAALVALGLLKDSRSAGATSAKRHGTAENTKTGGYGGGGSVVLDLTAAACCTPPLSRYSQLARLGLHLFRTKVPEQITQCCGSNHCSIPDPGSYFK
jgi:hypothetical protein